MAREAGGNQDEVAAAAAAAMGAALMQEGAGTAAVAAGAAQAAAEADGCQATQVAAAGAAAEVAARFHGCTKEESYRALVLAEEDLYLSTPKRIRNIGEQVLRAPDDLGFLEFTPLLPVLEPTCPATALRALGSLTYVY